ncbi:Ig lambda chain V-I region BL2 [Tupaia chinensis]|uniref:Ig lambda chain V-I region BL2 n=1 Tax=Tupaia chinensis TaxID=246437 RepID=L9J905_TUPCH|nr:Ig lambda chain V-I region BL2 [Tupaia chinensis]
MAWSPLLLTLLAHCTGSWAQSVLTQSPSVSGALGQSITISCTGSSNIGMHPQCSRPGGEVPLPACADSVTIYICLSGSPAKLTCTLSREHSTHTICWFQQQPGKAPLHVVKLTSDGSHSKEDGTPDGFPGSSSGADRSLTISNIQPEDKAGEVGQNLFAILLP